MDNSKPICGQPIPIIYGKLEGLGPAEIIATPKQELTPEKQEEFRRQFTAGAESRPTKIYVGKIES